MRLELADIRDGGLIKELTCAAADFPVLVEMGQQEDVRFLKPVQFRLRLQRSGQIVEVDGQLSTTAEFSCGHCLQPYQTELATEFALTYTPYVAEQLEGVEEDAEVELESDEMGLVYYQHEIIDLFQPLQDQLVMALPISPICKDDCKGLCPECGCNLNIEKCQCVKKPFNNKFSALAGLKIDPSVNEDKTGDRLNNK